jgi:GDP-L-fucose synthase
VLELADQRIIVTGGAGFLGRAVVNALGRRGVPAHSVCTVRSREFDLLDPRACDSLLERAFAPARPTVIIHAAGFVGGLGANRRHPSRFVHDNLVMGLNLLEAARRRGFMAEGGLVVQVGTMCSYPAAAPLPFREESLFTGRPDAEIAPYGLAKLMLLEALHAYRREHGLKSAYVIPVNLYGPGDAIDNPELSHAAGALIKRFVEAADDGAPEVVCWGTGAPTREFLYVDDAAEGVLRAAEEVSDGTPINLSPGREVSIRELAETIARLAGFTGRIVWDASKGVGVARRCLDNSRAARLLGFEARTPLEKGLKRTIEWYRGRK